MAEHEREDPAQRLHEQHAERAAFALACGTSFVECLRLNHLALAVEVVTAQGVSTIRGQDIYDARVWHKFLEAEHLGEPDCLIGVLDELAKRFQTWLLTQHTSRYRALASDLPWFQRVTELAVIRHILEQKHQRQSFADPWVGEQMSKLLQIQTAVRDVARILQRAKPEQAQEMIDQFFHTLQASLTLREPLLALPPGIQLPEALSRELPQGNAFSQGDVSYE